MLKNLLFIRVVALHHYSVVQENHVFSAPEAANFGTTDLFHSWLAEMSTYTDVLPGYVRVVAIREARII